VEQPILKSVEVFRRAGVLGYAGRQSGFYALIASVRPRDVCRWCALKAYG
jgi:hypothetical protein